MKRSLHQSLRQRTEKPFTLLFVLRLTVELPEFRFRLQALPPDSDDDQKLALEPRLLKLPLLFRLPANKASAKIAAKLFATHSNERGKLYS